MRFVIWTPAYQSNSAGITVLHRLCERLIHCGYQACVTSPGNPEWNEPLFDGELQDDDYVVYPEIIRGNPMQAKRVIRYMLWYPWHHFGNDRIPKYELVIPYAKFLLPHTQANTDYPIDENYILELGISDPALFSPEPSIEKTLTTYWVSKCDPLTVARFPMPKEALQINHGINRRTYIHLLKQTKTYFTFDMNSSVSIEASLCGADCYLITADNRVVPWRGKSAAENAECYSGVADIHRFVDLAQGFDYVQS